MSTIKKLLALVLALTMVLSATAFAGYTVAPYGDYAGIDADAEEAVQLLYSLNIMKGDNKGNFNPEATITRAEVAKMIYVILNYGEDDLAKNYTGAKFFSDVEAGLWYEGYINYAASTKLVQGRPDGTFGPNDPVTCAEAAKMLLTAIGYSAEARGYVGAGWDKQVLADAAIIGLLDGYDYNTNDYAPRQWVAVMFMNALTGAYTYGNIAPVVFNGLLTSANYDAKYVNFGWKYFGLYEWSGIITANEYADLYDDEALDAGETKIGTGKDALVFDNWTTDLTEIGEYRRGWACDDDVVYVGGFAKNVEFSCGGDVTIKKANIDGIKLDSKTEYFKDFEDTTAYKAEDAVAKGDWLRVVDNDDDGVAEYVFVTEFTMSTVSKITSSKLTLADVEATANFATKSTLAKGDVVVYAYIDGVYFVELAPSFSGEVDKYTYRNLTLTVDGEDYDQTEIDVVKDLDYWYDLEDAQKETEYTYYQDFFGNIGLFSTEAADAGEFVLLTDAYYEDNRYGTILAVNAYLDGEIKDVDVKKTSTSSSDWAKFISTDAAYSNNDWEKLNPYEEDDTTITGTNGNAATHVARYTMNDEGVMSLYTAQTKEYNKKGQAAKIVTDYIDLDEAAMVAGQRTYEGDYYYIDADGNEQTYGARVQANKETIFYYVSYAKGYAVVDAVVGYKNSYDVNTDLVEDIKAVYAVGTNVTSEYQDKDGSTDNLTYWVADIIVIETELPAFALDSQVVLGYNVVNKTYNDYAALDVIAADGSLDQLEVINFDGNKYNSFKQTGIPVLEFYFNTVDENGESYIRTIDATDYAKYDIYAGTLNRVAGLGDEYVVTVNNVELAYDADTIVVYDIVKGKRANDAETTDSDDDTLELTKGKNYIFYGDKDEEIVYAVLVNDTLTEALYNEILNPGAASAKKAAKAMLAEYAKAIDANNTRWPNVTEADLADAIKAQEAAIDACVYDADIAKIIAKPFAAEQTAVIALEKAADEIQAKKVADDTAAKTNDDLVVAVVDTEIVTGVKLGAGVTVTEQAAAIKAALVEAGYTDVEVVITAGEVTAASGKMDGITVNFTVNEDDATVAAPVDSDALTAALADADVETIVLGSGEYELTSVMNKDVTIIGNGETIVAGCPYDGELYNQVYGNSGSLTVKNVIFNSPAPTGSWNMAARLSGSIDATFEGCTFIGMSTAIYQSGADTVITIKDCTFETTGCAIQSEAYSGDFTLGQDLIIENCDFTGLADVLHIYDHDKDPSSEAIAAYLTANGNTFTGTCKQTAK